MTQKDQFFNFWYHIISKPNRTPRLGTIFHTATIETSSFCYQCDVSQWSSRGPEILTTSSRAALRPKVQVSRVRQLMKEVKSSLGRAIKVLRGNMVMRLEMMLEMPTASESSISILATKNKGRVSAWSVWSLICRKTQETVFWKVCPGGIRRYFYHLYWDIW